jgi:hypothetical protein
MGRHTYTTRRERVAQVVEHLTFNQGVVGSSPTALTNQNQVHDVHAEHAEPADCRARATGVLKSTDWPRNIPFVPRVVG